MNVIDLFLFKFNLTCLLLLIILFKKFVITLLQLLFLMLYFSIKTSFTKDI